MLAYRLANKKYIRDLSGTGARLYGGRWNPKGTAMLYTSANCSLAVLELIVHTPSNLLPEKMSLLKLSIPDDLNIAEIKSQSLPDNWRQYPAPDTLAERGDRWIDDSHEAALKVPSVLVPDEWNILFNPNHPDFKNVTIDSVSPFQINPRF